MTQLDLVSQNRFAILEDPEQEEAKMPDLDTAELEEIAQNKAEKGIVKERTPEESDLAHRNKTWIIYLKRSALGHSTRYLAETWLSEVDSLFCSRCRTCCAPLTKKGADTAATWTPSFQLLPALSWGFLTHIRKSTVRFLVAIGDLFFFYFT
ncbi:hypothetical protein R3W88_014836 [Solanum pinnatisectum]|uniref:Uncharacterized protein n=1 Tax=Solanum pinnatisectum TaxID=50273 RepID=A0AAV9KT54_9SOLN|nr:hypothetical protein R3W88_014836 [Solanum pinnatisectum]